MFGGATAMRRSDRASRLNDIVEAYREHLEMPDDRALLATLSAIAGGRLEGPSVNIMLVGPPSSMKNEVLECCLELPTTFHISSITESGFLSGTSRRDRAADASGGLLMEIGQNGKGTIVISEFNTILLMGAEERGKTLGMIRDIATGFCDRRIGGEGGRLLHWSGKICFLAGCTESIEEHQSTISQMGERFVYCYMPDIDPMLQAMSALRNAEDCRIKENRRLRTRMITDFFSDLQIPEKVVLDRYEKLRLSHMATFCTPARSAVKWDRNTREVENVYRAEFPARFSDNLMRIYYGAKMIGVDTEKAWDVVQKIALDSLPSLRRKIVMVMGKLLVDRECATTTEIRALVPHYGETTIRRALTELEIHGILTRSGGHANYFCFTDFAMEAFYEAFDLNSMAEYEASVMRELSLSRSKLSKVLLNGTNGNGTH